MIIIEKHHLILDVDVALVIKTRIIWDHDLTTASTPSINGELLGLHQDLNIHSTITLKLTMK